MTALNSLISGDLLLGTAQASYPGKRTRRRTRSVYRANPPGTEQHARHFIKYMPQQSGDSLEATVTGLGRGRFTAGETYPGPDHPNLYSFKWRTGRVLPEHQLLLLTGAHGEFESEATGLIRFHGDVLIYLFPGLWHRLRPLEDAGWSERWVALDGPAVARRLAQGGVTPERAIAAPEHPETLAREFDHLVGAIEHGDGRSTGLIPAALRLLSKAIWQTTHTYLPSEDIVAPEPFEVEDEVVRAALEIIWNDKHSPPLGVSDVAQMLPVTRRTLDRRFSEALGRSVLEEINACRFARAQRLLRETDLPVKAVSYLAGFPSRERMRILFIEKEGLPPRDYREQTKASRRAR